MQDFFQRHPALQPFLAAQLRAAAAAAEANDAPVPTLLPILTLLSRLRCATADSAPAVCSSAPCTSGTAGYGRLPGTCVASDDARNREITDHTPITQ